MLRMMFDTANAVSPSFSMIRKKTNQTARERNICIMMGTAIFTILRIFPTENPRKENML